MGVTFVKDQDNNIIKIENEPNIKFYKKPFIIHGARGIH